MGWCRLQQFLSNPLSLVLGRYDEVYEKEEKKMNVKYIENRVQE